MKIGENKEQTNLRHKTLEGIGRSNLRFTKSAPNKSQVILFNLIILSNKDCNCVALTGMKDPLERE